MSTNPSLKALRDSSPRNQPDFEAFLERYKGLGTRSPPLRPSLRRGAPRAVAG